MKSNYCIALAAGAALLLAAGAGCQTSTEPQTPPSGAVTAQLKPLPVGTQVVQRTTDDSGSQRTVTYTKLADDSPYRGEPVWRWSDGAKTYIYTQESGNFMAAFDAEGEPVYEAWPSSERFSWPLWVGKEWTARYKFRDYAAGRSWNPIISYWEVEAYEEVTVPAGAFKALRLENELGKNNGTYYTIWYAPESGLRVKTIRERTEDNWEGPGTKTTELIEYHIPDE